MKARVFFFIGLLLAGGMTVGQNPRNTLIEKGSSTWCDECICVDSIIQRCVLPAQPNTILLIYHDFFSTLKCQQCDTLIKYLIPDHSEFRTNRDGKRYLIQDMADYPHYCDTLDAYIKQHTEAPMKMEIISKSYNSQTRKVDFTARFNPYQFALSGTFMINAVLFENRILADQSMVAECGGYTGRRPCYHDNVVRIMAYQFGDQVKAGAWPVTETLARDFSFTLDAGWDPANAFVVSYIYKQEDSLKYSTIQQAVIQSVTGPLGDQVGGETQIEIVRIIPNPACSNAEAHLRILTQGGVTISLFDMKGREVKMILDREMAPGVYVIPFNTAPLSAGQYVLTAKVNGRFYQKPVTIVHN